MGTWTFNEDETGTFLFNVSDSETDVKNLILTLTSSDQTLIADTSITYSESSNSKTAVLVPTLNQYGNCTITVTVTDGENVTERVFDVEVLPVNDGPVISAADQQMDEDTILQASVNASDIESTDISFTVSDVSAQQPQHGQLNMSSDGNYTYTPIANYNGTDQFTVLADDGSGQANSVTSQLITITILPINDDLIAVNDSVSGDEDTTIIIDVLSNDSDIDQDVALNVDPSSQTIEIVADSFNGLVNGTVTIVDGKLAYVPNENFNGTETFTYQITDNHSTTATATVTVVINPIDDQPINGDDTASLAEDTVKTINVLVNDDIDTQTNPLLEELTITGIFSEPTSGSVVISEDQQQITYTPNSNYFGTDSFSYAMSDKNGHTAQFTVNLTITSVNDLPTISTIADISTNEDTLSAVIDFNVTDIEDAWQDLTVTAVSSNTTLIPNNRITIVNLGSGDRTITVLPATNRSGTANITVKVLDANGGYRTSVFKVTVVAINDDPVAHNDTYTTNENNAIILDILANDDVDRPLEGDTLTLLSLTDSDTIALGTTEIYYDSAAKRDKVRFTPNANWSSKTNQDEILNYTMTDLAGLVVSSAQVTITVTPVNDAPVISSISDQTFAEDANDGTGLLNFTVTDEESDDSLLAITVSSSNTTLIPLDKIVVEHLDGGNAEDRTVKVTSLADQNGTAIITLTVTDEDGLQATTSFTITVDPVDDSPINGNDVFDVVEDTPTTLNVLANDDIDTITNSNLEFLDVIAIATDPMHGSVSIASDSKSILYTPDLDNNEADSFTYTMQSTNGATATFTVSINITPVNDAPIIHSTISDKTIPEATACGPLTFTVSDVDDDWSTLNVTATSNNQVLIPIANIIITNLGNGDRSVTITPAGKWNGTSTLTLTVKDDEGAANAQSTTTFKVIVTEVNDAPVANNDLNFITNEDTTATLNVLNNDTDPDLSTNPLTETMTILAVNNVDHATVSIINSGKKLSFTPDANWNGTEEFTYTIQDAAGLQSTATVRVKINGRNDAPVVLADTAETNEDQAVTIDVLTNDSDIDTDILLNNDPFSDPNDEFLSVVAAGFSQLDHGTAAVVDGKVVFTPETNYNGTEIFTYTVQDASGVKVTGEITVVIDPINDNPIASDDIVETDEDQAITVDVLANDSDIDLNVLKNAIVTDYLTVTIKTAPLIGSASVSENAITYTPLADWNGTQSIVYTLTDRDGLSMDATIYLTVNNINDTPIAQDDLAFTDEDQTVLIDVLANDSDIDQDVDLNLNPEFEQITIDPNGFSDVTHGTVTIVDGKVQFVPESDYNGSVTFNYTVIDNDEASCQGSVTLTINAINDTPQARNDSATISENTYADIEVLTNDTDVDMSSELNHPVTDYLTVVADGFSGVEHGDVTIVDNHVIFTPTTNWNGTETFSYTITDTDGLTSSADITVTVNNVNNVPQAANDSAQTNEDQAVTIDALLNDLDIDMDPLLNANPSAESLTIKANGFSGVEHGTIAIVNNQIVYTPQANYNGVETFTYTIADQTGTTSTASVTIVINAQADTPIATYDTYSMLEDGSGLFDVLANDLDYDADDSLNQDADYDATSEHLTISPTGFLNVTHATVSIEDNKIRFVPEANYNGPLSFSYTITDATGLTAIGSVTINVTAVNDNPIAVSDTSLTTEDHAVIISVIANDSDVDLSTLLNHPVTEVLSVSVLSNPSHGIATVVGQTIRYTPTTNYNGVDSFTYTLRDKNGLTSSATVYLTVSAVNDKPVTTADSTSTNEDNAVTIDVLANDTDVDTSVTINNDPNYDPTTEHLTIKANGFSGVEHGTVLIVDNKVVFTPEANFNGTESFTYTVSDTSNSTTTGTVTITVNAINDDPIATNDTASTNEDNAVTIDVLANETDVDTDSLLNLHPESEHLTIKADGFSGVTHGTVSIVENNVVFTPETNFNGEVTFTYTITDVAGITAQANVTVTINAQNDSPIATNDTTSTNEDHAVTIDVLANDTDVDTSTSLNNDLNYDPATENLTIEADGFSGVEHGTVAIVDNKVVYTPNTNFNGEETFTYTITDLTGITSQADVTVTINANNDDPIASNDIVNTNEDNAVTIDVLANDTDVDTNTTLNSDPTSEHLTIKENGFSGVTHGIVSIVDNKVVFTPETNFNGEVTFIYTITDVTGITSQADVTVTINAQNDSPIASNDSASTNEDNAVTIDVLGNDTDVDTNSLLNLHPESELLTIKANGFSGVEHGTVAIVDNKVVFTPDANFNGEETFTYTVTDTSNSTATGTVTLTVNAINDDPIATNDTASTNEDNAITIDVLANDTDVDTDSLLNLYPESEHLTIKADGFSGVTHGTVSIVDDKVVFTPEANYNGEVIFSYTITDVTGITSQANVTLTINAQNDAPVASSDISSTDEDQAVTIDVLANDTDVDTNPLLNLHPESEHLTIKVNGFSGVEHGTVSIVDNKVVFTPEANFNGTESFTYTVSDTSNSTTTGTVTLTVHATNDDPIASNDTASTDEDNAVTIDVLANDTDVDTNTTLNSDPTSEHLTIKADGFSGVTHGTVTIVDNKVVFTPEANYNGEVIFSYTITDVTGITAQANVTLTIIEENDDPIANDDIATTDEDHAITIDVLTNDIDSDADNNLNEFPDAVSLNIVSDGFSGVEHGTLSVENNKVVYTPDANFNGIESFTYTIVDSSNTTATAYVTITVNAINDDPHVTNDSASTNEDQAITIDVLANDTDVDTDLLLNLHPEAEHLVIMDDGFSGVEHGSVTIVDNKVVFTPEANFNGEVSFTYMIIDSGNVTVSGNVVLMINAVNDAPSALDVTAETEEDTPVLIDVLPFGSDVDTDVTLNLDPSHLPSSESISILSYGFSSSPQNNFTNTASIISVDHASVQLVDGKIQVTPEGDFSGVISFYYTIQDNNGINTQGKITLTITPVNDAPSAHDDQYYILEDQTSTFDVLTNDTDIDFACEGDSLHIVSIGQIIHGTATISGDQRSVIFTPEANYNGIVTFTYTAADQGGISTTANITVIIRAVADPLTELQLLTPSALEKYKNTDVVHVTWTPALDLDTGVVRYKLYFFDGENWKLLADDLTTTYYDHELSDLNIETNKAQYRIEAWSNNSHIEALGEPFIIDNIAPRLVVVTIMCGSEAIGSGEKCSQAIIFHIEGGEDLLDFDYLYSIDKGVTWNKFDSEADFDLKNPGIYEVILRAVDELGNNYDDVVTVEINSTNTPLNLITSKSYQLIGLLGILLLILILRPITIEYLGYDDKKKKTYRKTTHRFALVPRKDHTLVLNVTKHPRNVTIQTISVRFRPLFTSLMRQRYVEVVFTDITLGKDYIEKDQRGNWQEEYPLK